MLSRVSAEALIGSPSVGAWPATLPGRLITALPVRAVLFDVDGTLVDPTPAIERATRTWAARYGLDPESSAGATVIAVTVSHPAAALLDADRLRRTFGGGGRQRPGNHRHRRRPDSRQRRVKRST
ncbi:hypothetical protein GCM10009555_013650 [Acrocarpospora macrocephala]|uniref:Hydrolase n=1 Tax=Acrocarpospora macrocephala TaxID=150177 RepID=A0A5M3WGT0_9ACTN|nr:hypothetical protein Amac_017690 [Acrocarpospora macrocephala]